MLWWILGCLLGVVLFWVLVFGLYKLVGRLNDFLINGR